MIEIPHRPTAPAGVPAGDVLEAANTAAATDAAQPDPWPAGFDAARADPVAKFNALFGTPPRVASLYADKNGAGGSAAPAAQIGGSNPPALKLGSHGPAVRALQHELNKWRAQQWPTQKPIAENGRFTAETKKAVEEFQAANRIQTGARTLDLTPNGIADVRVQNRLRLENDPAFAKLSPDDKELARKIVIDADREGARSEPLFKLLADPSFAKIGEPAQYRMLETLSYRPRDPVPGSLSNEELVKEYTKLASDPAFQKLDPGVQATAVNMLSNIARPLAAVPGFDVPARIRAGIDNLTKLATGKVFGNLPPDDQRLLLRALAHAPSDNRLAGAIGSLLRSPHFDRLKPDEKTAVLSQVANYPDDRSIANIERMLEKAWFRSQDLDDKQRSLKTIAYLSQHNPGDRDVIDNTLDKLLGADSSFKLEWDDFSASFFQEGDEERRTFGQADASTGTLTLNSQKVPVGNGAVPNNYDGKHLVLHTVAHEVNHLLNKDVPRAASFQHFETEYRAWVVGFKAEHGHYPTNKEAMRRVRQLLTADNGAYADIKGASRKFHDAMAMYDFLQKLTGREVTAGNLDDILKSNPDTWRNWSRDPAEQGMKQSERLAPLADGNLDNS